MKSGDKFTSIYVPEYGSTTSASSERSQGHGHGGSSHCFGCRARFRSLRRCVYRLSRLQKSFLLVVLMVFLIFSLILATITWVPQLSLTSGAEYSLNSQFQFNHLQNQNPKGDGRPLPWTAKPKPIEVPDIFKAAEDEDSNQNQNQHQPVLVPAPPVLIKTSPRPPPPSPELQLDHLNLNLFKPSSDLPIPLIPNIPRDLQPDFSDNTTPGGSSSTNTNTKPGLIKSLLSENVAEDIRKVISQDHAIPHGPKPKKERSTKAAAAPTAVINQSKAPRLKFYGPENSRQRAVVDAFSFAWAGYKKYAWGKDHLRPISGTGQDWFGLGLTLVDSLDTMAIMGLERELFEARDWVEDYLRFEDVTRDVNLFETTIRVLGGLLSAYHLTGEQIFLTRAQELGSILIVGFKSPSGVPYSDVNLRMKTAHGPKWNPDSTTSEVTTLQLEFRDLSRCVQDPVYESLAMNVSDLVHHQSKMDGLVPIYISPKTGRLSSTSVITLGARGDSYYEYLLKQWLQTGKKIDFLRDDYLTAMEGVRKHLVRETPTSDLTYIGELNAGNAGFSPKMDHLVCYLPGTLALGFSHGLPAWHLDLAKKLAFTCYQTYKRQPTGLAPEITHFRMEDHGTTDFYVKPADAHNLLRPETVESLYYLHQITGDSIYQEWGWEIFESFMKHTKVAYGFTSISNVLDPSDLEPRDMQESFFLAETLKYFYLLFSDKEKPIFDLTKWVFNTEAHPLPILDH